MAVFLPSSSRALSSSGTKFNGSSLFAHSTLTDSPSSLNCVVTLILSHSCMEQSEWQQFDDLLYMLKKGETLTSCLILRSSVPLKIYLMPQFVPFVGDFTFLSLHLFLNFYLLSLCGWLFCLSLWLCATYMQ